MKSEHVDLATLVERYDAFILDQFGVLLTGDGAYSFAPKTLKKLKEAGKLILMLSNSGKRASANEARLTKLGFDRADYLSVLSSGEAAYRILSERIGNEIDNEISNQISGGTNVFVLSRDQDTSCIDGLDLVQTQNVNQSGLIILAGSQGDVFELNHYEQLLKGPAQKGVSCICTNPDITMLTAKGLRFGSGQIAKLYEQLGGTVEWIGKPHPFIYKMAIKVLVERGAKNIVSIGDSPEHDIAGGNGVGIGTVLVRTGIHEHESLERLIEYCAKLDTIPDYILPKFNF